VTLRYLRSLLFKNLVKKAKLLWIAVQGAQRQAQKFNHGLKDFTDAETVFSYPAVVLGESLVKVLGVTSKHSTFERLVLQKQKEM
jgi:hypothetical protein